MIRSKKNRVGAFLAGSLLLLTVGRADAVTLGIDDTWVLHSEDMVAGEFFTPTWTVDATSATDPVLVTVTDWAVVSDYYEIYLDGALLLATPVVDEWVDLGLDRPIPGSGNPEGDFSSSDPSYVWFMSDLDAAILSGFYSWASFLLAPGDVYDITIRNLFIPTQVSGRPYPDGTVALKAEFVPEPGTILLLGSGLFGLAAGGRLRRRRRDVP